MLYAKEDILSAKRFDLNKLFAESPMAEYTLLHNNMLRLIEAGVKTRNGDSLKKYAEDVFVEKCILLIDYVLFEKDIETARQIKEAALKVVNDNRLNNVVTS